MAESVTPGGGAERAWWRDAVVYEVYPRSFADSDGDGVGDLTGLRRRLPYLAWLGVDALWVTPWYPSPLADGGYDVTDHRAVHPELGTLTDAQALVDEAHALGLRVLVDLVANHTSAEHPWFREALAAGPGSPQRRRYFFRDGRGPAGDEPPNDWISAFGGPAWTRTTEPDGTPGQWYLHLFAAEQPDLDWSHEQVADDVDETLRYWFDRGIDGIRVDAAPALAKRPGLPDAGHVTGAGFDSHQWRDNPHWDVDAVHDILRRWRKIADGYPGERAFVAEAVVSGPDRLSRYVRPDELHTSFNFDYLRAPWDATALRRVVDDTLAALAPVRAPATWVLSSHDETRHVTRYGRRRTAAATMAHDEFAGPSDLALGTRRARAAALLTLALPGSAYLYQGEELGLPEVEDLPDDVRQDPVWRRSAGTVPGRDGCRVPLPWKGDAPPYGFGPPGSRPWLPQPGGWRRLSVDAQSADAHSVLSLYRAALAERRALPGLRSDRLRWLESPENVLAFERGEGFRCVVNLGDEPYRIDGLGRTLLASEPGVHDVLPPDTAAWLAPAPSG